MTRVLKTNLLLGLGLAVVLAAPVPAEAFSLQAFFGKPTHGVLSTEDGTFVPPIPVASPASRDPVLKNIRDRLVRKQRVSFRELRKLADSGDGLAAYNYAERIVGLDKPELLADAAHYYSIAVFEGRSYAVNPLTAILSNPDVDIKKSRLDHIERSLMRQAQSGEVRAVGALVQLYKAGVPFGVKPERAGELMKAVVERNFDSEIALQLAINLTGRAPLAPAEIQEIRKYLRIAETSEVLGTRTAAENLLRSYPEPDAANDAG